MQDAIDWPGAEFLTRRVDATPDWTALLDTRTDREWTVRELDGWVDRTANALRDEAAPATTQPRVGLLLSPRPEFVVALYAVWRLGWTAVPLNTKLTDEGLSAQLDRVDPALVVYEDGTAEQATLADAPAAHVETAVGEPGEPSEEAVSPAVWEQSETALVLFTSGTTGDPKAVRLTLGNLAASATASAFRLGVQPDDRWLCCLPVYHMGGLAPAVRTVIYGTTLVLQREFDAAGTAQVLDEYEIAGVSLVPTQLHRLLERGMTAPAPLRTVLLGGAPASKELLDRASTAGVPVYPTYGLTETASQVATARPTEARDHPGTVGQPLLGTDVTILDDGEPVPAGERGEVVVDGPTVTPGYLDADRTAEAFGEWGLHTGDVGYRDEGGRLWVLGRRDDVIQTGGELVVPSTVVDALCAHSGVADAAVVGLPDEEWGERVAALVVPASDADTPETLDAHCRERLADFERPKTIRVVESLPRTPSGTVDRRAVREQLK